MVVVLAYSADEVNVSHPFNHTASNVAGNNHSDRKAVIRCKEFPVVHVSNDDILSSVQLYTRFNLILISVFRLK